MKARYRRKCPEDCSYRDRRTNFCGFCMLDILEKGKEKSNMQMMVNMEDLNESTVPRRKTLKEMVEELEDDKVLSISLEGMVLSNGQKTE